MSFASHERLGRADLGPRERPGGDPPEVGALLGPRDLDRTASTVVRIRSDRLGAWGEFLARTGEGWYDDGYAMTFDLDASAGEEITEARRVVEEELGSTWHPPPPPPG